MKDFFIKFCTKTFWKSTAILLIGFIAGSWLRGKTAKPTREIHTTSYIEDQEQNIGKIKQKGEGNNQVVEVRQKTDTKTVSQEPTKRQIRKTKRAIRRANRLSRKSKQKAVLSPTPGKNELSDN